MPTYKVVVAPCDVPVEWTFDVYAADEDAAREIALEYGRESWSHDIPTMEVDAITKVED